MSFAICSLLLWAQAQRPDPRNGSLALDDILAGSFFVAVLLVAAWLLMRLTSKQELRSFDSPRLLFNELCKAHGLERAHRKLLKEVARWQRLRHPGRLFLERQRYEAVNLSTGLQARLDELHKLRDYLFGVKAESDGEAELPKAESGERKADVPIDTPLAASLADS